MQFAPPSPGRIAAALVLVFAVQLPALACSCVAPPKDSGQFLHLNSEARITLPENALGVLYLRKPDASPRLVDRKGHQILDEVPAKLKAKSFVIRDLTTSRVVKTRLSPVDIDAQLGAERSSYLQRKGAQLPDAGLADDITLLAEKHGLRDISAAVRESWGLFRVAPANGFIAGHTYSIVIDSDDGELPDRAEVVVGPRLAIAESDKFAVMAQGAPVRRLLSEAVGTGMCSANSAAIVQQVRYTMPPAREPYRHLLAAFTQQQFFGADLKRFRAPAKGFVDTDYYPDLCSQPPAFGTSHLGQGKDMVFTRCEKLGTAQERRQVRGMVGMLELEESLRETPVLDVRFDDATGPGCWRLRLVEDGGAATALRGWIAD